MRKEYKGNNFTAVFTDKDGYFSLTGSIQGGFGAVGDKIAKIDPRFEMLEKMHLSNSETGAPMHDWANADHFIKEGKFGAFNRQIRHKTEEYLKAYNAIHEAKNLEKDIAGYNAKVTQPAVDRFQKIKEEIKELWKQDVKEVRRIAESIPEDLTNINEDISLDDFPEPGKVQALAQHLETHFSTITESTYGDNSFEAEGSDWLVVTDDEADELWDDELDNYLDECVLPELPENMQHYFDTEAWKRDARIDGRGHSLGRYDGYEHFEDVDNETYYIYQQ